MEEIFLTAFGILLLAVGAIAYRRHSKHQAERQRAIEAHYTRSCLEPDRDPVADRIEFHFSRDRK